MEQTEFIDIRKLVASKNPRLAKLLPSFVFSYLKRILHQDEVNDFMRRNGHLKNEQFCSAIIREFEIQVEISGLEHIPHNGGSVLAMNHPLGGMDAMALVYAIQGIRTDIKFIVNDLLLHLTPMQDLFVGVNKHGINERKLHQQTTTLFASDALIGIFPAGLVSRRIHGQIHDLAWRKMFVKYAKRHNKTIIPIYIEGQLSNFFYNLSNFRRRVGIKTNVEMLYLSDELYKQKGKCIRFVVGKPIDHALLFSNQSDEQIAHHIRKCVYSLAIENASHSL